RTIRGTRNVIVAARQLYANQVHRDRIDVGSITCHLHAAGKGEERVVSRIARMVLWTESCAERSLKTRRIAIAGWNGRQRGAGCPLGRNPVFLPRALITSKQE